MKKDAEIQAIDEDTLEQTCRDDAGEAITFWIIGSLELRCGAGWMYGLKRKKWLLQRTVVYVTKGEEEEKQVSEKNQGLT